MTGSWHTDPFGRHEMRYWDGDDWTEHVIDNGVQTTDALSAADAGTEELADEEPVVAEPVAAEPVAEAPPASAPAPAAAPPAVSGDGFAGLSGDLVSGTYTEVSGAGPQKQNERLLRVRLTEPILAQQGAMVAYQGNVDFAYKGGGAGRLLKKAVTGEGISLMTVSGQGDVFLADEAKEVHILQLTNSGLSVSGRNVLAFSGSLDWNIERIKGASMAAGGLFNTTLRGTGWVAITTHGPPVVLNAAEAPTFADTAAVVAWSLGLQTTIKSTFKAGALIGRGSGEAFQVAFSGRGFVIVQPSEGTAQAAQGSGGGGGGMLGDILGG